MRDKQADRKTGRQTGKQKQKVGEGGGERVCLLVGCLLKVPATC